MLVSVLVFASSLCVAQEVVASIPTNGEVLGFAIDLPGHRVYAAVFTPGDTGPSSTGLYIIDTQTQKLIKSVGVSNTSPEWPQIPSRTGLMLRDAVSICRFAS